MPHIRPINLTNKHETSSLDTIFRTTSGPAFKSEPTATIASHLYCHQYPHLSPQTCFALETDSGQVVGYILGTPSTASFASAWRQKFPSVLEKLSADGLGVQKPPNYAAEGRSPPTFEEDSAAHLLYEALYTPEEMFNVGIPDLWQKWPAHFHVDILPSHQRQGWGRKLIETMLAALKAEGAVGVHLGMEAGNEGTEKFYRAMGFERYPGALDGGVSGETGSTGRAVYMVKTL